MPPHIRLDYITPGQSVEILQMRSGMVTIGREPENGIVIDSEAVSRRHALIAQAGAHWVFRDLGSTNGSWVNDVQIKPDRIRLLRDGDVIQVANFGMRLRELSPGEDADSAPVQLLVFFGDEYQGVVPLDSTRVRCSLGGEGDIKIEGESGELARFDYIPATGRVELNVSQTEQPVILNGLATRGTASLSDADEVLVAGCRILVADTQAFQKRGAAASWSPAPTKGRALVPHAVNVTPQVGKRPDDDWSTPAPRRASPERFVFGSPLDLGELSPTSTSSPLSEPLRPYAGYDSPSAIRFSGTSFETLDDQTARVVSHQRRLVVTGALVLAAIIVAVAVILSS